MYISHLYPTHHKHWKNWSIFNPWRISVCVRTMAWTPCCQVLEEIMQLRGPARTSIWRWRYEGFDDYEEEQWITRSFHPSVKMGRTWLTSQSWMLSWKSASCLNRYPCKRHVAFQGHKRNVAGSSPGCSCFHSKFWMYNVWERLRLFVCDFPTKSSAEPVAPNLRSLLQAWQLHISTPKVSTRRLGQFPFGMGNDGDNLRLGVSDVSTLRNVTNALWTDLVDLNMT